MEEEGEMMGKRRKWIKVQFLKKTVKGRVPFGKAFWVSEKNRYFEWYKNNPSYRVLKEVEM